MKLAKFYGENQNLKKFLLKQVQVVSELIPVQLVQFTKDL